MIKHVVIVYHPGYAGNFLQRVMALNTRVFPVLPMQSVLDPHARVHYSTEDRVDLYSFATAKQTDSWQTYHRSWADFYQYTRYQEHLRFEPDFDFIVYSMHEHERKHQHQKILGTMEVEYLTVSLRGYQEWWQKCAGELGFLVRPGEDAEYQEFGQSLPAERHISLDLILGSEQGFVSEYWRMCNLVGIAWEPDAARELYREWRSIRVEPYL